MTEARLQNKTSMVHKLQPITLEKKNSGSQVSKRKTMGIQELSVEDRIASSNIRINIGLNND
jgi:hypothetical protein